MIKKWVKFFSIFLLLNGFVFAIGDNDRWENDLRRAQRIAQKSGKLIFVDVGTSWCGYCNTLKKEVFPTESFQEQAKNYVLVRLDGDKNEKLMDKLKVHAYPTLIYFKSNGKEIGRTNYLDAKQLSKKMAILHKKHSIQFGRASKTKKNIKKRETLPKVIKKREVKIKTPDNFRRHILNKCQILPKGYKGE